MPKAKDSVISLTGNFEHVAATLAARTAKLGGSLSAAMVYLSQPRHESDLERIAVVLADVCKSNSETNAIIAPEGGRIHIIRAPFNPARDWQEAITAAGPDTPQNYNVRKVDESYPPMFGPAIVDEDCEIILVNFGRTIPDAQYALDWGKGHKLRAANPRQTFAVGEHCPTLNRALGMSYMAIISPDSCSFEGDRRVPGVWWDDARRRCGLYWFDDEWHGSYWFAFVRE